MPPAEPTPPPVHPRVTDHLDDAAREGVRALARRAADADGTAPLSERFLLTLDAAPGRARHLLVGDDGVVHGYGQVADDGSAELVVDPAHRRRGLGTALLAAAREVAPGVRVWAHGNLPAASALARAAGLEVVRELHRMSRPLTAEDAADVALPDGYVVRPFEPGRDEDAWVATNAAAFADHPEQGGVDRDGLAELMTQPWFAAEDLLLVEDPSRGGDAPAIAAFHWTKVDPEARSSLDPASAAGEVYVLGVHPAHQGRGLARPLTALGLAHLARRGLPEVVLYVDGDNAAALSTYRRAGFTSATVDVMYARPAPA